MFASRVIAPSRSKWLDLKSCLHNGFPTVGCVFYYSMEWWHFTSKSAYCDAFRFPRSDDLTNYPLLSAAKNYESVSIDAADRGSVRAQTLEVWHVQPSAGHFFSDEPDDEELTGWLSQTEKRERADVCTGLIVRFLQSPRPRWLCLLAIESLSHWP